MTLYVGTSGWQYRDWRGTFYPAKLPQKGWLEFYADRFQTVEVNNTFYNLPAATVFDAWKRQAPAGFVYALKASRYLTHRKKLNDPEQPLDVLLTRARRLGDRLGPVLYQLPADWHCNVERLRRFIALLPHDVRHVFEFRDPTWYTDGVRELLTETGMNFCVHDLRGVASPVWVTGPLVYLRFHGPTAKAYAGKYRRDHLRRWADKIEEFRGAGRDVYAYFNNDDRAYAVTNARQLQELISAATARS